MLGGKRRLAYSSLDIGRRVDAEIVALANDEHMLPVPVHDYTRWFVQYCYHRRWLVCGTQVPLWQNRTRTQADVICWDLDREVFVLIELKTGYDNDYEQPMRRALVGEPFEDSHYWRHQLQLGWMYHQLQHALCVNNIAPEAYVLRISAHSGVREPHALHRRVIKYYESEHQRSLGRHYLTTTGNSMDVPELAVMATADAPIKETIAT